MLMKTVLLATAFAVVYSSDVLDLTDSDFSSRLAQEEITLVKFYAPWCGHCKRLAPEFDKASTILKANDPPVALAKVDCTEGGKDICSKHGVSGYPTLKIFRGDELSGDYEGPRESDGIVKYMKSKAGPASKLLSTVEELEKFLANDEHSIVGFFDSEGSDIQKQFQKLADAQSEDYRFAHTLSKEVNEKKGYSDNIVIFQPKRLNNKFEPNSQKYDGDSTLYKIKSWVNDNLHGLAGHRTGGNNDQFKKPLVVAFYDVDYVKNTKGTNYWRNRVMKVAKKLKDEGKKVFFAVSNKDDFSHELQEFGISDVGDKPMIAARDAKDQKFIMEAEFSMDALEQFVNDLLDGKLEPYLKSEAIPTDSDEHVATVVAKNFDKIVNDADKDVLIEFYAPWCGHCKTLAPKYEELAEKLKDEDSITIAKMDATANDVPAAFNVRGFPTIYYAPKNSKSNPKKYEGGREVDDFLKYLAKESTDGLKGFDKNGKKQKVEL